MCNLSVVYLGTDMAFTTAGGAGALHNDDHALKEEQQQRHYRLLSQLQSMSKELPSKYQQRFSYDLLSSLASACLDGTVCEIVKGLKDVQQLEERALFSQRTKLLNEHRTLKQELQRKHRDALQAVEAKPHQLPYTQAQCSKEMQSLEQRCEQEIKRMEMRVILDLDQKVMDQQVTLEKSGVPGFFATNNPQEVKMQMHLLAFIIRIASQDPVF